MPDGRSEQYLVYAVLDALVATAYDVLNGLELELQELSMAAASMREARVRTASVRRISAGLTEMRRRLSPQRGLFERISEEIGRVEGLEPDSENYFERIRHQMGTSSTRSTPPVTRWQSSSTCGRTRSSTD